MIVKLAKGTTTPVLLTITGIVRDVPSNNVKYGPQHKLVGHTPTDPDACIFLAPDTAIRQLGRVGLTLDTAFGHTVAITRPGDYIDFTAVGAPLPALAAQSHPTGGGKQPFSSGPQIAGLDAEETEAAVNAAKAVVWKRLSGLHRRCLAFVLETEIPMLVIVAPLSVEERSILARWAENLGHRLGLGSTPDKETHARTIRRYEATVEALESALRTAEQRRSELANRVALLDRVIGDHHDALVMREENDVCPVCMKHGGTDFFAETIRILRAARG